MYVCMFGYILETHGNVFLDVFRNCQKHPTIVPRFLYATSGQCNMDDM